MKCPKCGYISFDYNQVCPKCSKDITAEQAMLNLPAFRPDTPFLLEMLVGEGDVSDGGLDTGEFSDIEGDTAEFGTGTDYFDGDPDTEEVEFTDGDSDAVADEGTLSTFDFDELESDSDEGEVTFDTSVTDFDPDSDIEGIGQTTGELTEEETESAGISLSDLEEQEDELDLDAESVADLDDVDLTDEAVEEETWDDEDEGPTLNLEYADSQKEAPEVAALPDDLEGQEVTLDIDSSDVDLDEAARATDLWTDDGDDSDEVPLDLDDLTVDESGELRVETGETAQDSEEDLSLDLDDLDIDLDLDDSEEKPS